MEAMTMFMTGLVGSLILTPCAICAGYNIIKARRRQRVKVEGWDGIMGRMRRMHDEVMQELRDHNRRMK